MITWRLVNQEGRYYVHGCTCTPVGILCNDKGSTNAANKQRYAWCRPKDHAHAKKTKGKGEYDHQQCKDCGCLQGTVPTEQF
jgi:hypothetical protein